jgi:hypothetical protein
MRTLVHVGLAMLALLGGTEATQVPSPRISVRIHAAVGYEPRERTYAFRAAQQLENLLNSPAFYNSLRQVRLLDGQQPSQVYERLLLAREAVAPYPDSCADHVLDFWLRLDGTDLDCDGTSIGSDDEEGGYVNTCPKRVRCWAENDCVASMADHLLHEYLHHLGYDHRQPFARRKTPYVVGDLAYDLLTDEQGPYKLRDCEDWPSNRGACAR